MNTFTVAFFGHRDFSEHNIYEEKMVKLIKEIISSKDYVNFIVGRNGEFDIFSASCIRRAKRELFNVNSSLILYLPYVSAGYENNKDSFESFYDEVYICEKSSTAHYKAAIQIRNKEIADISDLIVFCVSRKKGGAYETFKYAIEKEKNIINIIETESFY